MNVAAPTIKPVDNKHWLLWENYSLTVLGLLITIHRNFKFDGASIPRLFWRVVGHPLQGKALPAAVIHDGLYRAQLTTRKEADKIFHTLLKLNEINKFKAWLMYRSVRTGGKKSWKQYGEAQQIVARQFVKVERKGIE